MHTPAGSMSVEYVLRSPLPAKWSAVKRVFIRLVHDVDENVIRSCSEAEPIRELCVFRLGTNLYPQRVKICEKVKGGCLKSFQREGVRRRQQRLQQVDRS